MDHDRPGFCRELDHPRAAGVRTGKKVAVVGSGPAGLGLRRRSSTRPGTGSPSLNGKTGSAGLLMYGIPNMKLDKEIVQRRAGPHGRGGSRLCHRHRSGQGLPGR